MRIPRLPNIEKVPFSSIEDKRKAVVLTTEPAWKMACRCSIKPQQLIFSSSNTKADMDRLAGDIEGEVVYGIGGGLGIDTAKYIAAANGLPLVVLPTILSTDAFLTDATGVRENGCVRYLPSKSPDTVIIDMDVLCSAPVAMRASGDADVLSIATAIWDWEEAEHLGENPPDRQITPHVLTVGNTLLQALLDNARETREIGKGTPAGMTILLDLLCMEVQLCNLCGHSRIEEGSEHYFVYSLEKRLTHPVLHGELVGLGILLMAILQSQPWLPYQDALAYLGINYALTGPQSNSVPTIPTEAIVETRINLSEYVTYHQLPYTIATTEITPEIAEHAIQTVLNTKSKGTRECQ